MFAEAATIVAGARSREMEHGRDRSLDIIRGINVQEGDWVKILNPRLGQSKEGVVIGKTRDNLIKIEGRITIGDHEITKVDRRISENIDVVTPMLTDARRM